MVTPGTRTSPALLPEWTPQWGVLMAWPHSDTDWQALLAEAESCYSEIARAILARENLLLLCRDASHEAHIRKQLGAIGQDNPRLHFRAISYNDTWTRDYGPLTVHDNSQPRLLDFVFNGWGNKFPAARDNAVNSLLHWSVPLQSEAMVLEGGSVEVDGCGTLLTTRHCLLNPNRNPQMSEQQIEAALCQSLGVSRVWWLEHGHLEGDDTDAHIDTLARFCDEKPSPTCNAPTTTTAITRRSRPWKKNYRPSPPPIT